MIDTIKIKSPELPPEALDAIAAQLRTRMMRDNATGEILSEFTSGMLEGSFDHRIKVDVCREKLQAMTLEQRGLESGSYVSKRAGLGTTISKAPKAVFHKVPCSHIILEGSVHKAMAGVNFYGGPEDAQASARFLVGTVAERLGVSLPDGNEWSWMRADWAECFRLGSFQACQEFLSVLRLAKFPRRKMYNWSNETVGFSGTTTGIKIYHKGPEFTVNDAVRLRKLLTYDEIRMLQEDANDIIRVETTIKLKKFNNDFSGDALVPRVTGDYLARVHDQEVLRVIRESEHEMNQVRQSREVEARLLEMYGDRLGGLLYGTWMTLSAHGEDHLRGRLPDRTFYRQRKQLQEAGVCWFGSDVQIVKSAIPEGFSIRRSDSRRITGESDAVRIALMPYRSVAA